MRHERSMRVRVRNKMIVRFISPLIFTLLFVLSGCEKDKETSSANEDYINKENNVALKQESLWEKGKLFLVDGERLNLITVLLPWNTEKEIQRVSEYYENVFPYITALALSNDGRFLAWGDWSENVFIWDQKNDNILTVNDSTISRPKTVKQEKDEADIKRLHEYYMNYALEHGRVPSEKEFMRQFEIIRLDPNFCNTKTNIPPASVESIRFTNNNELYWLGKNENLWHTQIRDNEPIDKKKINQDLLVGYSGIITNDSLILCESVDRNILIHFFTANKFELRKYDLLSAQYEKTCKIYPPNPKKGFHIVEHMSLSPDGSLLAIASDCNSGIVRLKDFKLIRTLNIELVTGMALSGDNSRFALGTKHKKLIVLDTEDGRLIYEAFGNFHEPEYFYFENNEILWMASFDGLFRINLLEGKIELFWEGPPIHVMISDIDRRRIYLGCRDGTVRILGLPRNKVK